MIKIPFPNTGSSLKAGALLSPTQISPVAFVVILTIYVLR